ncbi:DUF413 domain-containing protein [Ruegeria marisflavi]|uniref:DUF413 domain-containing protein n=1 Tax=Ruegeria marisflavi TaxID=2984152 RepID=UPI0037C8EE58
MARQSKPSRYGRFTLKDARLLESCIGSLQALEEGRREPTTAMQVQFVSVCLGKAPPRTAHELAYMRWRHSKPHIPDVLAKAEAAERKLAKVRESASKQIPESLSQRASTSPQKSPAKSQEINSGKESSLDMEALRAFCSASAHGRRKRPFRYMTALSELGWLAS